MSRKRPKRRNPLPALLETPIRYKLDLTRKLAGSTSPAAEAEGQRVWTEVTLKLRALAAYHDVETEPKINLLGLVLAMACDQLRGFQLELEGTSVTRKVKWTLDRKIELLALMRALIDNGMTEHQAAEEYRKYHGATYDEWLEPNGIISRFHEFEAWSKSEKMTGREAIDFFKRMVRQRNDLTNLAERLERARPTESRCHR